MDIKSALEYLVGLGKAEVLDINGQKYSTKKIEHIKYPKPAPLQITTLTGLVDYIKSDVDLNARVYSDTDELLIQVASPTHVRLFLASIKPSSAELNFPSTPFPLLGFHG